MAEQQRTYIWLVVFRGRIIDERECEAPPDERTTDPTRYESGIHETAFEVHRSQASAKEHAEDLAELYTGSRGHWLVFKTSHVPPMLWVDGLSIWAMVSKKRLMEALT